MDLLKRICPSCKKEIIYKSKTGYQYSTERNAICWECSRKIPHYTRWIEKYGKEIADKKQQEYLKKKSEKSKGENNPRYGKNIYTTWVEKYGKEIADEKFKEFNNNHSARMSHTNNPMYGKSIYDVWVEKHGEEIANEKLKEWKIKVARHAENNGMFGKPPPKSAGHGWSGYYKTYYFRSSLELSYLKYLIDNNVKFETAETDKFKIEYKFKDENKNYFPDFYLNNTKEVIEIKPSSLKNNELNQTKFEFAIKKYGEKFKVLTEKDIKILSIEDICVLYLLKEIIFEERSEQRFLKSYSKNRKKAK